jgi:hypothetical protein
MWQLKSKVGDTTQYMGGILVGNFKAFPAMHKNYTKEHPLQVTMPTMYSEKGRDDFYSRGNIT